MNRRTFIKLLSGSLPAAGVIALHVNASVKGRDCSNDPEWWGDLGYDPRFPVTSTRMCPDLQKATAAHFRQVG